MPAVAVCLSCGGDSGTSNNHHGVVQISSYIMNPMQMNCAAIGPGNLPPRNIGAPDSIVVQLTIVNTTADTVTVNTIGAYGQVISGSDPADVGKIGLNTTSLSFVPKPLVVPGAGALGGQQANVRVTIPTEPICNTKPIGFSGSQNLNISIRATANSGQYVTDFQTLVIQWR
ncbi:MAG TPA: hypothetical protein VE967_00750 [Gemmatimonadaceae bacterium]|nr:hypothetical protein [Gemmatimonadaceae bacterium]